MAGRNVFTREMVLETAFSILRGQGWNSVTARTIAKSLGASTMPIYSIIGSMDEIREDMKRRCFSLLQDYQQRPFTEKPLMNLAVGYVVFARDEANAFRFLFEDQPDRIATGQEDGMADRLNETAAGGGLLDQVFPGMKEGNVNRFVLKNWVFSHGLAVLHTYGILSMETDEIRNILSEAGGSFLLWEKERKQ